MKDAARKTTRMFLLPYGVLALALMVMSASPEQEPTFLVWFLLLTGLAALIAYGGTAK